MKMDPITIDVDVLGLDAEKLGAIFASWGSIEQAQFFAVAWCAMLDRGDGRGSASNRAMQCGYIRDALCPDGFDLIAELAETEMEADTGRRDECGECLHPGGGHFPTCYQYLWMPLFYKGARFRMPTEADVKRLVMDGDTVVGEATHMMPDGTVRVMCKGGDVVFMKAERPLNGLGLEPAETIHARLLAETKCGYDPEKHGAETRPAVIVFGKNERIEEAPPDCPECHGTGKYESQVTGDSSPCSICCPEETL